MELFTRHHVFTESEIHSRYEIRLENYVKTIHIEARTMADMINHQFLPALMETVDKQVASANAKKQLCDSISTKTEKAIIEKLTGLGDAIYEATQKLIADTDAAEKMEDSLEAARFYQQTILSDMSKVREAADEAETMIPAGILPYPTYADILFYV